MDEETAFTLEFSRADRNRPASGLRNKPGLSEAEHTILFLLDDEPSLTNAELARRSGKSERTVSRIIAKLKNKNLIRRYGSKKTGYRIVL